MREGSNLVDNQSTCYKCNMSPHQKAPQLTLSESDQRYIDRAIEDGLERKKHVRAKPGQLLTYILSRNKTFHHGTLESASNERYFLQAAFGRKVRIHKIWNVSRKEVKDDFYMVRAMLDETEHWDPAFESLDRILKGAGFE